MCVRYILALDRVWFCFGLYLVWFGFALVGFGLVWVCFGLGLVWVLFALDWVLAFWCSLLLGQVFCVVCVVRVMFGYGKCYAFVIVCFAIALEVVCFRMA